MRRSTSLLFLSFVMALLLIANAHATEKHIRVEVLPGLAEPSYGNAFAINDNGQIVGVSGSSGTVFATLWERGHGGRFNVVDLGTLGGTYSYAYGINDMGEVVGSSASETGAEYGFLWRNGQMTSLGSLMAEPPSGPYTLSVAYSINNRGQVVGFSSTDEGGNRGFLWQDGEMSDLGSLGAVGNKASQAYGINSNGQIVGWSITGPSEAGAVTWVDGEIIALGNYTIEAYDVNEVGQIVGVWGGPTGNGAFLWQDGVITTFWGENSIARGVNDCGQVVGYRNVYPEGGESYTEALLWDNGVERVLPLPANARGAIAHSINNRGQIVGDIITQDWFSHPVLWTMAPSPQRCSWQ